MAGAANNGTERPIGLTFKIPAGTMRGSKSPGKVRSHPYLAGLLGGTESLCDLRAVI